MTGLRPKTNAELEELRRQIADLDTELRKCDQDKRSSGAIGWALGAAALLFIADYGIRILGWLKTGQWGSFPLVMFGVSPPATGWKVPDDILAYVTNDISIGTFAFCGAVWALASLDKVSDYNRNNAAKAKSLRRDQDKLRARVVALENDRTLVDK